MNRDLDLGGCRLPRLIAGPSQLMSQWAAFGIGVAFHGMGLGAVMLWGLLVPEVIEQRSYRPAVFVNVEMRSPYPPVPVTRPKPPLILPNHESPSLKYQPRLLPPRPAPEPAPPKRSPTDPPILATSPSRTESKPLPPPVQTGVFGGRTETATLKLPAREVQTGGFGDPQGLRVEDTGARWGNVARLGAFNLPAGEGQGNGAGGTHGARGLVASAGFGSAPAGSSEGGARRASVQASGFDAQPTAQTSPSSRRPTEELPLVPIEILAKPRPVYTEEARKLRVQGEVVLSVVFGASGKLRVLGVVRGLGHGLDEAAVRAAEQMRFKPAQRGSEAVDFPATLRVVFELAG